MSKFVSITGSRYRAMVQRIGVLPFTLAQFREWFENQLSEWGDATRCVYCGVPINIETTRIDHKDPVERGGALTLDNLAPCCDECNRTKGKLTAVEFKMFITFLRTLAPSAERDIRTRLKTGEGFRRIRFFNKNKARR